MVEGKLYRELCELVRDVLVDNGVCAVTSWEESAVEKNEAPVVVVSLRASKVSSAGFADYLGERWDESTQSSAELYGHRSQMEMGLDIYAPPIGGEKEITACFEGVVATLGRGISPHADVNLKLLELRSGDTVYDGALRRKKRTVEAKCQVHLYTVKQADATFVTFEIKGEMSNANS